MWTSNNPLPVHNIIGERIRYYHHAGVKGYTAELLGHSPDNTLSIYLLAKLLWDADQDPDALLAEFFGLYFQESAEPMRQFYQVLSSGVLRSARHGYRYLAHRSRGNLDPPLDSQMVASLRQLLTTATDMARQPVVQRRLEREVTALRQYELEVKIQELIDSHRAKPSVETAAELRETITAERAHYKRINHIVLYRPKSHTAWLREIEEEIEIH